VENKYGPVKFVSNLTVWFFFYYFVLLCFFLVFLFVSGSTVTNTQRGHEGRLQNMQMENDINNVINKKFAKTVHALLPYVGAKDELPSLFGKQLSTSFLLSSAGLVISAVTFILAIV